MTPFDLVVIKALLVAILVAAVGLLIGLLALIYTEFH